MLTSSTTSKRIPNGTFNPIRRGFYETKETKVVMCWETEIWVFNLHKIPMQQFEQVFSSFPPKIFLYLKMIFQSMYGTGTQKNWGKNDQKTLLNLHSTHRAFKTQKPKFWLNIWSITRVLWFQCVCDMYL